MRLMDIALAKSLYNGGNPGGGSGTGGVSSWNDLTDKPFYSESSTILEETTLVAMEETEGAGMILEPIDLGGATSVTVVYNGVEYNCEPIEFDMGDLIANIVGNGATFGFEDTGEPFTAVITLPSDFTEAGFGAMVLPLDGSTEFTFKIISENITPIPQKYLPKPLIVDISDVYDPTFTIMTNIDGTEIEKAVKNGIQVILKVTDEYGNTMFYNSVGHSTGTDADSGKSYIGIVIPAMGQNGMIFSGYYFLIG